MCTKCTKFTKEYDTNYIFDISIKILWINRFIIISSIILRVNQLSGIHFQSTREYITKIEDKYSKTQCSPWSGENVTYNDRIILYLDITSIDVRVASPRPLFAREKRIENEYKQRYYVEICWLEKSTRVLFLCTFFSRENFMKNRKKELDRKLVWFLKLYWIFKKWRR